MDRLSPAFPDFSKELLEALLAVCSYKEFRPGEYMVKKGQLIRSVHLIVTGFAQIIQEDQEGNQFVIAYLKPGNSFGVSISEDSPEKMKMAVTSIVALEDTCVYTLPFSEKDRLAKIHDRWYKYILQTAVVYYSFYLDLVESIAFQQMDTRISYFLDRLQKARGTKELNISHQEIAQGLNSSREVVSRLLKKMEMTGRIRLGHGTITILKPFHE